MSILSPVGVMRSRLGRRAAAIVPVGVLVVTLAAAVAVARAVDGSTLAATLRQAVSEPLAVLTALGFFGLAFVLRALAWRRVLPGLSFGHALAGIHVALGANHVLPLRLGEAMRAVSVARRTHVAADTAIASTLSLRTLDTMALTGWALLAAPAVLVALAGAGGWLLVGAVVLVGVAGAGWLWLREIGRRSPAVRPPSWAALGMSALAWPAEAVLVHTCARWAGLEISAVEALGVTAISVVAQIAAIAPGGFGTYEVAAVAAYAAFGYDASKALAAALAAHALKTAYSVVAGGIGLFVPSPALISARARSAAAPQGLAKWPVETGGPDEGSIGSRLAIDSEPLGPVVLFMPAFNEGASVADCVRRVPESVAGREVRVLVIDDGSADDTAAAAAAVGAEVISLRSNRGLGAAVRVGLAAATDLEPAAVAFCDADGEYAPEELPELVAPILTGRADYVVGSRFNGRIEAMLPHRRFGNRVLTAALCALARRRVSDGQSGYRAFSRRAAADAEIIHDYNYAQVLTLDLLDKGYRYAEVPISYTFRTTGESFVKLGRYLRHVVPGVARELTVGRCRRSRPAALVSANTK